MLLHLIIRYQKTNDCQDPENSLKTIHWISSKPLSQSEHPSTPWPQPLVKLYLFFR